MKRLTTYAIGSLLTAGLFSAPAIALDRANVGQKGSLLVFPKIDVSGDRTTIVRISNDHWKNVDVQCYWQNGYKFTRNFLFPLTGKQTVWFDAYTGEGSVTVNEFPAGEENAAFTNLVEDTPIQVPENAGYVGELKCWAVDKNTTNPIRWNHLYGSATIIDYDPGTVVTSDSDGNGSDLQAAEYTAWAFRCLVGANGDTCGADPTELALDGSEYETCPKKLVGAFSPYGVSLDTAVGHISIKGNQIAIATCNQDFRQDRNFHFTKLKFNVWNSEETKFTGAWHCIDSWNEVYLRNVQNNSDNFLYDNLGTEAARLQVRGIASAVCDDLQDPDIAADDVVTEDAGLVGVILTAIKAGTGSSYDAALHATNLNGVGDRAGFVRWDAEDGADQEEERPAN